MKARVTTKVGNATYTFQFDDGKDMEVLHLCAVLGNPPQYCDECKNNQFFKLDSNKDKEGNIYVNVVCTKCGAKSKLGQYKVCGYFWKKFEKYVKPGEEEQSPKASQEEPDDLPW